MEEEGEGGRGREGRREGERRREGTGQHREEEEVCVEPGRTRKEMTHNLCLQNSMSGFRLPQRLEITDIGRTDRE